MLRSRYFKHNRKTFFFIFHAAPLMDADVQFYKRYVPEFNLKSNVLRTTSVLLAAKSTFGTSFCRMEKEKTF